jgi:hypothetical protein
MFPEKDSKKRKSSEKVFRHFQDSIKVSFLHYDDASPKDFINREMKDKIGKSIDEISELKKQENAMKKPKMKSFARIPLQHDEYQNVRLSMRHVITKFFFSFYSFFCNGLFILLIDCRQFLLRLISYCVVFIVICLFITGLIHNPYAISPPPNLSFIMFSVLFQSALPSLVLYSPLFTFSIFFFGPLLSSYSPSLPFCFSSILSPSLFFLIFSRSSLLSYSFFFPSFLFLILSLQIQRCLTFGSRFLGPSLFPGELLSALKK